MSVNSKMTALADEIRELSGTTTPKSIDAMTTDVNAANTEIAEQADLLNQIVTALEGKAGGGGVNLPSLSNPASASDIINGKEAIDGDGNKITGTITTQAAKTVIPSTTSQTAVASGVYTTGAVTVAPIPSNYEDVGVETNIYTMKLASLETAVSALETELAGKASSGGGSISTTNVSVRTFKYIFATVYENGGMSAAFYSFVSHDGTIANAVSKSGLTVLTPGSIAPTVSGATLIEQREQITDSGSPVYLCLYQVD